MYNLTSGHKKLYTTHAKKTLGGYPRRSPADIFLKNSNARKGLRAPASTFGNGVGSYLRDYLQRRSPLRLQIVRASEINLRRLIMPDHFPRDISLNLIQASCTLHFLSLIFTQGEKARPITLDISASDGLACVLRHVENQIRQALEEIDSYVDLPEGDVK